MTTVDAGMPEIVAGLRRGFADAILAQQAQGVTHLLQLRRLLVEDRFLGGVLRAVHDFCGDDPRSSPDYGRIVNTRHFDASPG